MRIQQFIFSFLIIFCACQKKAAPKLSEKAYTDFTEQLAKEVNSGNYSAFTEAFDVEGLVDTLLKGEPGGLFFREKFVKKFKSQLAPIGSQMGELIEKGGTYTMLHMYVRDDVPHALFRLHSKGVNYHDLTLVNDNGKVKIGDMYTYLSGEKISTSIGRVIGLGKDDPEVLQAFVNATEKIHHIKVLIHDNKGEEAIAELEAFPEKLKNDKSLMLLRILAAKRINNEVYNQTISRYERLFPNDPSLDLLLIDGYILRNDYPGALASVNRLDKHVNDPYLDMVRGNIYFRMEDLSSSEQAFRKLIQKMKKPEKEAYTSLAIVYMEEEKYPEALSIMQELHEQYRLAPSEILDLTQAGSKFRAREDVKKWIAK